MTAPFPADALFAFSRAPRVAPYDFAAIVREVCAFHGVTPQQLLGRGRTKDVAEARHHLCYELRDKGATLEGIGALINRDHSTALYGVRRWALVVGDARLAREPNPLSVERNRVRARERQRERRAEMRRAA